jgi:hypothetical protein
MKATHIHHPYMLTWQLPMDRDFANDRPTLHELLQLLANEGR